MRLQYPVGSTGGAVVASADMKKTPAWKMLVELVRSFVGASVLAGFAALLGIGGLDWCRAAWIRSVDWISGQLLTGSVIWENVPWELAAIHAGDWLVKLLLIGVIVSVWQ